MWCEERWHVCLEQFEDGERFPPLGTRPGHRDQPLGGTAGVHCRHEEGSSPFIFLVQLHT